MGRAESLLLVSDLCLCRSSKSDGDWGRTQDLLMLL